MTLLEDKHKDTNYQISINNKREQRNKPKYKSSDHIKYRDVAGLIFDNHIVKRHYDKVAKCYMYLVISDSLLNSIPDYEWVKEENIIEKLEK